MILFLISFPCLVITDKIFFRGTTLTRGVSHAVSQRRNEGSDVHTNETITEQWFEQRLDHFSPADTRTWKQVSSPHAVAAVALVTKPVERVSHE